MYVPKVAAVGILALVALTVMPFFFIRILLFFVAARLIFRMVFRHRFKHAYHRYHSHYENHAEPLAQGDYRFFARRFEKEYAYDNKPTYSDKDLV